MSSLANLVPPAILLAAFATACQSSASAYAASPPPESAQQQAAPFPNPPVLPGTPDVATLVAKVRPSVVNITTEQQLHTPQMGGEFGFPGLGELFPFFNQGQPGHRGHPGQFGDDGSGNDHVLKQQALGSGFIVDTQGHIVTNAHVVDGADVVKV
ncbi:MAG: hypothetical protein FWD17_09735, partial [Polyangiaceae bacterium]|nr:hypothetical protein [Polyangiaceae bacterium]